MNKIEIAFEKWKKRLKDTKIRAICKPCWELNYCPYGSVIEKFPVSDDYDFSCRIFGHECPVFSIAEPFTETKKLRNIDRQIPREVILKVTSRDKQVCQICGKNVMYDEIQYDHIIPWSKGGSSNEGNIRLVCSDCNKKRGNNFEDEYLVGRVNEHMNKPFDINLNMLEDLLGLMLVWNYFKHKNGRLPTKKEYCVIIHSDDEETDKMMYGLIKSLYELLESNFLNVKKMMNILRYRWGIKDRVSHSISETCTKFKIDSKYFIKCEIQLLFRLNMRIKKKFICSNDYINLKVTEGFYELLRSVEY